MSLLERIPLARLVEFGSRRDAPDVAAVADGIGPALARVVTWPAAGQPAQVTDLVARARALGLAVHPYTVRRDDLPQHCPDLPALHAALFGQARVDGVFTDFPDRTSAWLRRAGSRP